MYGMRGASFSLRTGVEIKDNAFDGKVIGLVCGGPMTEHFMGCLVARERQ